MEVDATARSLAQILLKQDKYKGDLTFRAEGVFQSISALATTAAVSQAVRNELRDAIVACCKHFNEVVEIGRGESARHWPTNRFAIEALTALGIQRPNARAPA